MTRLARSFRSLGSDKLDSFTLPHVHDDSRNVGVVEAQAAAESVRPSRASSVV